MTASLVGAIFVLLAARAASLTAQQPTARPAWCAKLPRPAYATLPRVQVPLDWFEVYRVDPDVYAIYEPHQWREVISYLIVGRERALLFDTGMGIADIRAVVSALTDRPVTVLNSHSHSAVARHPQPARWLADRPRRPLARGAARAWPRARCDCLTR